MITSNCPTDASDQTDINTFNNGLSSPVGHIPLYNQLIIDSYMNALIGKDENNEIC